MEATGLMSMKHTTVIFPLHTCLHKLLKTAMTIEEKSAPTVGVEPTTFGLEVQRASPLRHAGLAEQ